MCSINYSSRSKLDIAETPNETKEEFFYSNKAILNKATNNNEDFERFTKLMNSDLDL